MAESYAKVPRSTVQRYKTRAKYDFETIHTIVNTTQVLHVSFPTPDPEDPFPAMIPMLGFMASYSDPSTSLSEPLDLYLHGYISSRLMKLPSSTSSDEEHPGLPLTIAATHLDGLVLALTPNHHSYNYRSAILHGFALPVTDEAEKLWAMEQITNGVVSSRWDNSRVPPTKAEMVSTQILKVRIVDASAKVRAGPPGEDREDLKNMEMRQRTWVGVVPTWMRYGKPVPSKENLVKNVPSYLAEFLDEQNRDGEKIAVAATAETE